MKERNSTVVVPPGAIPKTAKFLLGGTAGLVSLSHNYGGLLSLA